jgi:hypothetical protein
MTTGPSISHDELSDLLKWTVGSRAILQRLREKRLLYIGHLLSLELKRTDANDMSEELGRRWSGVSISATERILHSPAICQALRTGVGLPAIWKMLLAEFVLDGTSGEHLDHWTALGDVWLGAGAPPGCDSSVLTRVNGRFHSPTLACGIPIDLSLPLQLAFPSAGIRQPDAPDGAGTSGILQRLDRAISLIKIVPAIALDTVLEMTSNLVLRTDIERPSNFRSASSAAALGRTVLVNTDAPIVSEALLAEALVHEAIHAAVACVELDQPLVQSSSSLPDATICSPWSGESLPLHAFIHACLVWFGLLNFWTLAEEVDILRGDASVRSRDILAGFESLRLGPALGPYRHYLARGAESLLSSVQERALAQ